MDIRRSFKEIIAPLLVVSACGAGLPFLVAYFNMFIGSKETHTHTNEIHLFIIFIFKHRS